MDRSGSGIWVCLYHEEFGKLQTGRLIAKYSLRHHRAFHLQQPFLRRQPLSAAGEQVERAAIESKPDFDLVRLAGDASDGGE